ncbi:ferredoxin--NADP reductase [Aquimarina sp. MMG016]|uniref:ferredoxin--NADP reductase n=1 Tax=Aquimarina sp. MMG016 TaxID=2822690 RepID=UPI001B3A13FE|nr:ferredoxin--NADP reductase [Aquimarina sp. MMG016]MBQ4821071.1 ferredoxin--NADP reductase [Aquimarina sp. MMG016]
MLLTVKEIIPETDDAVSVILKNNFFFNKIKYKAGQFLTVKILINNKVEKRAYSFSSSPVIDNFLKITVKKVEKGLVSNYICNTLKPGQKIEVEKPAGSFFIVPNKNIQFKYILFAGGSGITPIFSIIKTVLEKEPLSKIILIYANRNEESTIFKKAIENLEENYPNSFAVEHILEKKKSDKPNYHQDLLNKELIDDILKKHNTAYEDGKYMMCGPQGFMDKAKEILAERGITRDKIKLEAFSANFITSSDAKKLKSSVIIYHDNQKHTLDIGGDKTILQAAMANNIMLPYSCRSGMCSSCKAKCISGTVKMIDGHLLSEEEVAEGHILTCISFPTSDNVSISFIND